ncbi:transcriptional regulator [Cupriavidus taiwanensis]|uniref:transcriptional regulator n=1 Tax=Cupriavidus taiwanensis TaxID=164546 RepID=UPI0018DE7982|nr:YdaS family helix-turn-helix protein [Cupriavidus taiwanensis]
MDKTTKQENAAMRLAVDRAGGLNKLAKALGKKPNAVSNWLTRGVPVEFCPAIEAITGVPCEELNPKADWKVFKDVLCRRGRGLAVKKK